MGNVASAAPSEFSEDGSGVAEDESGVTEDKSTATDDVMPFKYPSGLEGQEEDSGAKAVGRQHGRKRKRATARFSSYRPDAKRPQIGSFFAVAARTRQNALQTDNVVEAVDVLGSKRRPRASARRQKALQTDDVVEAVDALGTKRRPRTSARKATKKKRDSEKLPDQSKEPVGGKSPRDGGGRSSEDSTAPAMEDPQRALEEAVWLCTRMHSTFDVGVTMDEIIPTISQKTYQNLGEEEVMAGIGSLWRALLPHVRYSFHDASSFQQARSGKTDTPVTPPSDTLIIPLLFNTGTFTGVGKHSILEQWVLVVASHEPPDARIQLDVFYHKPGKARVPKAQQIGELTQAQIREAARKVVRNAQWSSRTPAFSLKRETWHPVCNSIGHKTARGGGTFSSAHLVVLTAWAYMLGLPIPSQMKQGTKQKDVLCPAIQRLVAMALDGRLTCEVIALFIKAYFVAPESEEDGAQEGKLSPERLKSVSTYMMNADILGGSLESVREDPTAFFNPPSPTSSAQRSGYHSPTPQPSRSQSGSSSNRRSSSNKSSASNKSRASTDSTLSKTDQHADEAYWDITYTDWKAKHHDLIERVVHRYRKARLWVEPETQLTDEQVFGAIGALWGSQWHFRPPQRTAFGDHNAMQFFREEDNTHTLWGTRVIRGTDKTSVDGRSLPLMMPMCGELLGADFAVGEGHWVFVVAQQAASSGAGAKGAGTRVRLRVWNSAESLRQHAGIAAQARQIVKNSGWLGDADDGAPPSCVAEAAPCPQQRVLDSCGIYAVLNAWCFQLGLRPPPERLGFDPGEGNGDSQAQDRAFVDAAVLTINLALHAAMDVDGIRAFLMASGYVSPGDLKLRQEEGVDERCLKVGKGCKELRKFIRDVVAVEAGGKPSDGSGGASSEEGPAGLHPHWQRRGGR